LSLTVPKNCSVRLGHISLVESLPDNDYKVKLLWRERSDLGESAYQVVSLVESDFSDTNLNNYHIAWRLERAEDMRFVKYFRVYRDESQ